MNDAEKLNSGLDQLPPDLPVLEDVPQKQRKSFVNILFLVCYIFSVLVFDKRGIPLSPANGIPLLVEVLGFMIIPGLFVLLYNKYKKSEFLQIFSILLTILFAIFAFINGWAWVAIQQL